jgi:hypothetical protein
MGTKAELEIRPGSTGTCPDISTGYTAMWGRLALPTGRHSNSAVSISPRCLAKAIPVLQCPTIQCLGKLCRNLENPRRHIQSETRLSHLEALAQGQGHEQRRLCLLQSQVLSSHWSSPLIRSSHTQARQATADGTVQTTVRRYAY